jgi:hypothetical protein
MSGEAAVTDQRSLSPRATVALLTLQLRAALKEAAAAEAEADAAGVEAEPSLVQLRDRIAPLVEERRQEHDAQLAEARLAADARVAAARARADRLRVTVHAEPPPKPVIYDDELVPDPDDAAFSWSSPVVAAPDVEPVLDQVDVDPELDGDLIEVPAFAPPAVVSALAAPIVNDETVEGSDHRDPDPSASTTLGLAPPPVDRLGWDPPLADDEIRVDGDAAGLDEPAVEVPEIVTVSDDEWSTWRRPDEEASAPPAELVPVASQPQPTTVMIDTESFAKALALAIATVVEQLPERQAPRYAERPSAARPAKKSSLRADAWHLDVMLLLVALFIVAAVLAAWMA